MKKFYILPAFIALAACSTLPDWLGSAEEAKLKGDRVAVMAASTKIEADPTITEEIDIPPQLPEAALPNNGNLQIKAALTNVEVAEAGSEASDAFRLISKPAQAGDLVLAIDGNNNITALNIQSLKQVWQQQLTAPEDKQNLPTGGIAASGENIFITTGFGDVIALKNSKEFWRAKLGSPIRNAPTIDDGKVFVSTSDNRVFALNIETGETLWQHTGASEVTSIFGGSSPAVRDSVVVAAYSSGEIFGISAENGKELWTELISISGDKTKAASNINDIVATPVIADGIAYVTSASGNFAAYNLANGFRIWNQSVGGTSSAWVAGRFVFVISDSANLVALNRFDGRIKWVKQLDEINEKEKIVWNGPVMAGDKLLLVGTHGKFLQVDAKTGAIIASLDVPKNIYTTPVVINGAVFLLSNDAKLIRIL